jgi:hypothetical protein
MDRKSVGVRSAGGCLLDSVRAEFGAAMDVKLLEDVREVGFDRAVRAGARRVAFEAASLRRASAPASDAAFSWRWRYGWRVGEFEGFAPVLLALGGVGLGLSLTRVRPAQDLI